jgi:cytochrome P450
MGARAERIVPTNARLVQQALSTDSDIWTKPPPDRFRLGLVLGQRSVLFSEGEEHRLQRRILNPAFSRRQIRNYVPVFWKKAMIMGDKVAADAAKGEVVDIGRWSSLATLDIIGAAGLGYEFDAMEQGEDGNELAAAYATFFSRSPQAQTMRLLVFFIPIWILYWLPTKRAREIRTAHRSIGKVCAELISTKRRELAEKKAAGNDTDDERDILSVLIKSGEYETADGAGVIRDQLMTFLAAGHETTATQLSWAIHLLIEYPKWQKILRDEIRGAFPLGCPESITFEQLESLKSLQNFASEAIRFFPPVPLTLRQNNRDTTLNGVFVPKGTHLAIVPWALHKQPDIWGEDAEEFKPERWEGDQPMESNYNLLTFMAGPRNCIGKDFAKSEFKALLALLVGRFQFEGTGAKIEIQGGITSRPKALKVIVKEVAGW